MSLQVEALRIYPIKSCGWLEVSEFEIGEAGPQLSLSERKLGDRQWLFVDAEGKFLTQRSHPTMCLIQPILKNSELWLQLGSENFPIPQGSQDSRLEVSVWGKKIDSVLVSAEISQAASEFLRQEVRLVEFDSQSRRESLLNGKGLGVQTRFTDSQAYLVVTEESLKDLNGRMKESIGWERFRPNIVLKNSPQPYAEDEWSSLRRASSQKEEILFESTKSCARCKIITVDPSAGKIKSAEPLKVLADYRRRETAVYFGQYFFSKSFGQILRLGDQFTV